MNAVDAAEDLLKIGRQLQDMERTLCLPPALAGPSPVWQALLVDPAVRLEELLVRQSTTERRMRAARQQVPETPIGWPIAPLSAAQSNATPSGAGSPLRPPASMTPTARTRSPYPTVVPGNQAISQPPSGQDIQLARDHTALQSIMNSNLHKETRSLSAASSQGGPTHLHSRSATGEQTHFAKQPSGHGADDEKAKPSSTPGQPPRIEVHSRDENEASLSSQLTVTYATGPSLRSLEPGAFAGAQTPDVDSAHGATSADSNEVAPASIEGGAVAHWGHSAPLWPDDVNTGQPGTERAGPWSGAEPASLAPSQEEGSMIQSEHTVNSGLLHPVQVEQILDAFNERLELLLLRAYGP